MEKSGSVKKALNNPLIVNNIFKCMDWQTICVCRQVSEIFYDNSLNTWRDLAPSICISDFENPIINTKILNRFSLDFKQEEKFRWGGVTKPRNISILCTDFTMGWKDTFPFLGTRGDYINKLHIDACTFSSVEQLRDIIECKNTPNLSSLKLDNLTFNNQIVEEANLLGKQMDDVYKVVRSVTSLDVDFFYHDFMRWPFRWDELLSIYPNLQKIRLADCLPDDLKTVFKIMVDLHKANKLPPLTTVDVGYVSWANTLKFPLPLYEAVRDIDNFLPNLNSISIGISHSDNLYTLPNLLECLADRLRHLKVDGSFTGKNRSLKVPVVMPKLVSITLVKYHLKNLNFLSKTPNIEKLYIYETRRLLDSHNVIESTKWDDDGVESVKIECTRLNTFACNQVVLYSDENIFRLKNFMPNLSTLKLHLNDSSFFAICKHFPKLRRLHICQSKVTDYGFTGDRFCHRFKDSNDRNDKKRSGDYYKIGFSLCDSDVPLPDEPDDSDNDECGSSNDIAENTEDEKSDASGDDHAEKELSIKGKKKTGEDKELDGWVMAEEHDSDNYNNQGKINGHDDGSEVVVSDSSNTSEDVSSDDKWYEDKKLSNNLLEEGCIFATENMYQQNANYFMPSYEACLHRCPYNASCFQGLEVLVIERCANEYGRSGLVSTIPFVQIFSRLPKLSQVWAEDGAVTVSGLRYASGSGLYYDYSERNEHRPKFID